MKMAEWRPRTWEEAIHDEISIGRAEMRHETREYPKDIKPLIMDADERIFYDADCLLTAGYVQKGTLQDYADELVDVFAEDPRLGRFAHKIPVWGKGDKMIVLTELEHGLFGFGGWLTQKEESLRG